MRCEGCGADFDEALTECAYCRTKNPTAISLEAETQALLDALEARLDEAVTNRTAFAEIVIFFLFLLSGPACYFVLDAYTENGLLVKIILAILTALFGFLAFGWQLNVRDEQAELIAWRDSIGPEIRVYTDRMNLANTEFMVLAQRLLGKDSRLRKVVTKWMIG
jgi:hypothetical protein